MRPHLKRLLLATFLLAWLPMHAAQAWWNSDWNYRMRVVADTTTKGANVNAPIGRTQILVRLHTGNFDFSKVKDDGSDLRIIAADDRTPLHFDIEKFDGLVDQVALIWVDVPNLAPAAQTPFYIYWGNKNATAGADPKGTYSPNQVLVYNFGGNEGPPKDSTAYGNNALTPSLRDRSALIGNGAKLDGTNPILLPKTPSLAMGAAQAATWSMWVDASSPTRTSILYSEADGANSFVIGLDNGIAYASLTDAAGVHRTSPGTALPATGWHLISVTSGDHLTVYLDGQKQGDVAASLPAMAGQGVLGGLAPSAAVAPAAAPGAAPAATPAPPATPATPGAAPAAATPAAAPVANFTGNLDEFVIAKEAVQPGAMQAAVAADGLSANLLTFDVAEQASFFGGGVIGVILRSVGLDSWVIIGILAVMALVSWWVMGGKAVYLSRLNRNNIRFRKEYNAMLARAQDDNQAALTGLSPNAEKTFRGSSLYRLYHIGSDQLFVRLEGGMLEAGGVLRPQSISAIRAAIDAGLVRETIRMNRLMVLLTICIAGGPFIGLLGTVVGVMITFAAIAQAGDVNVNAIAPGISAALLATVAGLFVAIPALFGYNYLLTRIRDAAADMNAFVDELVTRMGEGMHPAQRGRAFKQRAGE
jgi:biopolymer transport protein ExbB